MNKPDSITIHDQYAADYDQSVQAYGSYAAEVLFGLSYEFIQPNEKLLDIGIGTGLGSIPFAKAGLQIFGMDGSAAMLEQCRAKKIARELKLVDLHEIPWPYAAGMFDHALACGVFHFFGKLDEMLDQTSRLLRFDGTFAFSVMKQGAEDISPQKAEDFVEISRNDVPIFVHSPEYMCCLFQKFGFEELKRVQFAVWSGQQDQYDWFDAYVVRCTSCRFLE
jgi:predicted TPR repeat methyltransferase